MRSRCGSARPEARPEPRRLPGRYRRPGSVGLPADDEGLDVVPAVAVGRIRDALLEFRKEISEESGRAVLALAREGLEEERPAPGGHAAHVAARELGWVAIAVGIVETEEFGALELEAGDPPAARLEGGADLVQRAHPHWNDDRGKGGGADAPRPPPVGEQPIHRFAELHVGPRAIGPRGRGGRDRCDVAAARRELHGAQLEHPLPLTGSGHAPGSPLGVVDVVRVAREDRAGRRQAARVGDPVQRRTADRDVNRSRRQAGRPLEGDAGQADHRGRGRAVLDRSSRGLPVGRRRGVVGARAVIGDSGAGVARRGDDDNATPVRRSTERVPHVSGRDSPGVRRKIDECVHQRPAGPLLCETVNEAVRVDSVGGAEVDHAEHRLVRKPPRRGQGGRVRRLERGALRERVPRVVVRHARELGAFHSRSHALSGARRCSSDGCRLHWAGLPGIENRGGSSGAVLKQSTPR